MRARSCHGCQKPRQDALAYLQVGCERVGEPHVPREGTEDEVAKLDAVGWNNIAEAVVVVTQELWEVMQQDQQHTERALEKPRRRRRERRDERPGGCQRADLTL